MLRTIAGRYLLFAVLGVEALLLPYFLPKEVYAEVEFYKFTAFLTQFLLFGAGTGYVIRYLRTKNQNRDTLTTNFFFFACLQALVVGVVFSIFGSWVGAILAMVAILAIVLESIVKVKERYLLAMSFKPLLSIMLICFLPIKLIFRCDLYCYLCLSFVMTIIVYGSIVAHAKLVKVKKENNAIALVLFHPNEYLKNITKGFVMNLSTAMMFIFFYIDRAVVRKNFPDLLGDYSLSYSIMQLTIVAITTFSYVNLIEFGKEKADSYIFKEKVFLAFRKCLILFLIIGTCSVGFAYCAEIFYGYEQVFETTSLMVVLFGLANVLGSLNAVHLYIGSVGVMTAMMLLTILTSITINWFIPLESTGNYYLLLGKTYGLYLFFAIFSFLYIHRELAKRCNCLFEE